MLTSIVSLVIEVFCLLSHIFVSDICCCRLLVMHYVANDIKLIDCSFPACWDVFSGCFFMVCDDMQSEETAVGPIIIVVFHSLMWLNLSKNREVVHV